MSVQTVLPPTLGEIAGPPALATKGMPFFPSATVPDSDIVPASEVRLDGSSVPFGFHFYKKTNGANASVLDLCNMTYDSDRQVYLDGGGSTNVIDPGGGGGSSTGPYPSTIYSQTNSDGCSTIDSYKDKFFD